MVSLKYSDVYIKDSFSIAGPDEMKGNIKNINFFIKDLYYGEKTFEAAEIKMQKTVLNNLLDKSDFDLVIGGDLSNQLGIMNTTMKDYKKSFLGLYNACATFIEGMIIGANLISHKDIDKVCVLTSSHTLTSERQFRFPNEYGSLKPCYGTSTITASIGCILTNIRTGIKIVSSTIGNVVDYGIKDVGNMGAVMAPSAASAINEHLYNNHKTLDDYDLILTGDLGILGCELLKKVLKNDYGIITEKIIDAGSIIYKENQKKCMGGSGPTCIPLVLFNKILRNRKIKRIMVVGTGALHNPTLVNQKNTIPSISHIVEIEVSNVN